MSFTHTRHRFVALALAMACGFGSLPAAAQTTREPLSNPTVEELIDALSAPGINKAMGFRPSPLPDTNHRCQAVAGSSSSAGNTKTLGVVPYDGAHSASTDLAVNFALGSDRLLPDGRHLLDKLATALQDERTLQARFAIAGHTDAVGSDRINLELSCARAIAVRNYLVANGVSGNRLSAYGFGKDRLLNLAQPNAAVNRRVELRRDID